MSVGRDSESDGVISGGRRWRPIRGRSRRGYSSGRGGEFSTTTSRQPPPDSPFGSMPRSSDLCYARQASQYTIRFYQANTGFSVAALPLPLSSTSRFSARNRAVRGRAGGGRESAFFHARRVTAKGKVSDKKGEGNELRSGSEEGGGGHAERTKEGSEVFVGERGMHGSVSACT